MSPPRPWSRAELHGEIRREIATALVPIMRALGVSSVVPTNGASKPRTLPEILQDTPVSDNPELRWQGALRAIVKCIRAYRVDLNTFVPDSDEYKQQRGMIDGMQMAVDILCKASGVAVDDPLPRGRTPPRHEALPVVKVVKVAADAADTSTPTPKGVLSSQVSTLTAIVQAGSVGIDHTSIRVLVGLARSTVRRLLRELRAAGLVERGGLGEIATAAGRAALPDLKPLPKGAALLQHWIGKLPEPNATILRALDDHYPIAVSHAWLRETYHWAASTLRRLLRELRARHLIVRGPDGSDGPSALLAPILVDRKRHPKTTRKASTVEAT